jgi:hypothetical protein
MLVKIVRCIYYFLNTYTCGIHYQSLTDTRDNLTYKTFVSSVPISYQLYHKNISFQLLMSPVTNKMLLLHLISSKFEPNANLFVKNFVHVQISVEG